MRIAYVFRSPREEIYKKIIYGELPSNILHGLVELKKIGCNVCIEGRNIDGVFKNIINFLNKKYRLDIKGLSTLIGINEYDVIVVYGPISTITTLVSKVLKKKIVYLNTLFVPPKSILRKKIIALNINLCDGVVINSRHQLDECSRYYNVKLNKFKYIPFCLDVDFCKSFKSCKEYKKSYILSIGRDDARDYKTLIDAVKNIDIDVKIVTMPYLLKNINIDSDRIEILDNLSYQELYDLYSQALFVVIPLKKWGTSHASGLTSLIEAKVLGKAAIASESKPLSEYFAHNEGVVYVPTEDVSALREQIIHLLNDKSKVIELEGKGQDLAVGKYNMGVFAAEFSQYLGEVHNKINSN